MNGLNLGALTLRKILLNALDTNQDKIRHQYGGGKVKRSHASIEPEQKGIYLTVGVLPISKEFHQQNNWRPRALPHNVGNHILEAMLLPGDYQAIKAYCQQESNKSLVFMSRCYLTCVTTRNLQQLISQGEMINDNVMNIFLELLANQTGTNYLSTYFITKLRNEKSWTNVRRWFVPSYLQEQLHKPHLKFSSILIPFHVGGCHWVALVRRIIRGRVHFFYSDDMDHHPTEQALRNLLSSYADPTFYPSNAKWVECHSTFYTPYSNECGPRTLLALLVMGLHPAPNEKILLSFMSRNLAQTLRIWIASNSNINPVNTSRTRTKRQ